MRVLLVSINRVTEPYPVYPLGLDYVAEAIGSDHEVRLLDLLGSEGESAVAKAVAEFEPEVVGISLRNIDNTDSAASVGFIEELRDVVQAVRAATGATLVLGGAGFTLFPLALVQAVDADFGVVGEGERFADLLAVLARGEEPISIPGIVRAGAGDSSVSVPAPWDGAPRRRLPARPTQTNFYLSRGGMLNLQTKRGCPFSCFYCTYPLIEGQKLRRSPPAAVGEEALGLQEAGARYLFIADSVFNSDHAHAAAVAEAMREAGVTIPWGAFFAPLAAPAGFYQLLGECGCTHVEFGTDTLSPRMLTSYRKSFTVDDVLATHEQAVSAKLHVAHYFMLGGPGEDLASVDETLDHAERLTRCVCFFFCGIRIYPQTELWRQAIEEGQIAEDALLLEPVFYRPEAISPKEVIARVEERGGGRTNWVVGTGGEQTNRILERMYARGRTGPLWEFLIR